jgi:hypothetical protein
MMCLPDVSKTPNQDEQFDNYVIEFSFQLYLIKYRTYMTMNNTTRYQTHKEVIVTKANLVNELF